MSMSAFYGSADSKESLATIDRAIELGVNFFDTADIYGPYTNEELLGRALKGRRDKVFMATKFGFVYSPEFTDMRQINGRPEYVRSACEASLKRLQMETIDLYYLHRIDPKVPIEETVGAMCELVNQGKVRYLGLSETSAQTLRKAHATHPIAALQNEYSLWTRDVENEILPTCRELGISFVAYSPLGRGFLAGRIKNIDELDKDDSRRKLPRFQGENFDKNLQLVNSINSIADEKACKSAQLLLSWLLAQYDSLIPIPGMRRRSHLEDNIKGLGIELTANDLKRINELVPPDIAAGARYPDNFMQLSNR